MVKKSSWAIGRAALGAMLAAVALAGAPAKSWAGVILQNAGSTIRQVNVFEQIGQTFTAIDAHVLAALYYECINCSSPNADDIRVNLYEGAGVGGTLLASDTFHLTTGFVGFRDSDFTAVTLTVGNVYTFTAQIVGNDPYWGVRGDADLYPGGQAVLFSTLLASGGDMQFRVTGVDLPEPATVMLLVLAVAGLAYSRRRARASLSVP